MLPTAPAFARSAATGKERAMWLVEKLVPDGAANNLAVALQVGGRLRPEALRAALAIVLGRYQTLRTVFLEFGADLFKQVVPAGQLGVDIELLKPGGAGLEQDLAAFVERPFRFDGRPLVRMATIDHPDGDVLCVVVHHLVFDMTSVVLFLQAFVAAYDAIAASRPVPAAPAVAVFAEPEPKTADLDYWREALGGVPPGGVDLWCGVPRGRRPAMTGESVGHVLSSEAQQALLSLQRSARAPLAAVLLAGYAVLLAAHGAGPDLVINAPFDVRGPNTAAIGYHVNVLPLRVTVDFGEGFRALVRKARDAFLGAMAHPYNSVDDLAGELSGFELSSRRVPSRHLLNFLPELAVGELEIAGLPARLLPIENAYSKYDLEFVSTPSRGEVLLRYSREIFSPAEAEALLRRFDALLAAAGQEPDRPLADTAGWSGLDRRTVDRANDTAARSPHPAVAEAFAEHVANAPQAAALAAEDRTLSYRDVHERADAVRVLLAGAGVQVGDVVAAAVSRMEQAAVALGVWRTGAVLLPLDPEGDPAWLGRQIEHAQPVAVLTGVGIDLAEVGLTRFMPRDLAGLDLPVVLSLEVAPAPGDAAPGDGAVRDPAAPACLIHDCGADGQPVPRMLSHAGLADAAGHFAGELGVGPGIAVLSLAGAAAIGAILDLSLVLSAGGRLVLAPERARRGGVELREVVERHGVSVVPVPSGTSARILEDLGDRLAGLTALVPAGEVARAAAGRLLAAGCRLRCVDGAPGPTGRVLSGPVDTGGVARLVPITGTCAFVAAPDGRELPIGVRGELCVAGTGLAWSATDDDAFPVDERYGRYVRTGMLALWRSDGTLELLGRISRQVATLDGPVGLGEVEAVLFDCPGVSAAAAVVVARPGQSPAIVAFAEHADGAGDDVEARLLAHTTAGLAAHAAPRLLVRLDALPRTPDRRPDQEALQRLAEKALGEELARNPAADDPLCADLIGLWRTLLNAAEVTAQTHFFEAGGHSLLAAVLADRIEQLTGLALKLGEIFEHPTPAALAARLRK
jgi:non-ribosomal peptide synthetase component F